MGVQHTFYFLQRLTAAHASIGAACGLAFFQFVHIWLLNNFVPSYIPKQIPPMALQRAN
jgi:hypothetical protein